jgi:hypothetical protein
MDMDSTIVAADQVRKWKTIAIIMVIVTAISLGGIYVQSSNNADETIILDQEEHGVQKIATVDVEPGKTSTINKNT